MRIALLHNRYLEPGGEGVVFDAEIQLLREAGHEVVTYEESNARIAGMNTLRLAAGAIWSREQYLKVGEFLRSEAPDVAHFHNFFPLLSPSVHYACRQAGIPVVQTLHNYRLLCPAATFFRDGEVCELCLNRSPYPGVRHGCYRGSRPQSAVVGTMLVVHRLAQTWDRAVDAFIALSRFARDKFITGGLPPEKIHVKPNFTAEHGSVRTGPGAYVAYVGRLSAEKGIRTLLAAARKIPDIPIRIAGDGPLRDEVVRMAAQPGSQIEFLGRLSRSEVLSTLRHARFLVAPSECYENFPMVIVEAFSCGVPVVASRLGALAEIVDEDRTGVTFRPGAVQDLAAAVKKMWLLDTSRNIEMGEAARSEYLTKYSADHNLMLLEEIYGRARERHEARLGQ